MPDSRELPPRQQASSQVSDAAAAALAKLRESSSRPFEEARAMPPEVYTSSAFLELEKRSIFSREWQCLGRARALANPGDYLTAEVNGHPLIVVRPAEGALRAMSNVRLHRMSLLLQ